MTTPLPPLRVRIFIDFWNFQLSLNKLEEAAGRPKPNLDWTKVAPVIIDKANEALNHQSGASYEGLHVYTSYTEGKPADDRHKAWATDWLDRQPGVVVQCVKRSQKRSPPKCPACHTLTATCHHCNGDMRGWEEKGVDTGIVTDMMSLAWNGAYDVAVLLTSDRDFIPVTTELQSRGIRVIHAKMGRDGMDLAKTCWTSFDMHAEAPRYTR